MSLFYFHKLFAGFGDIISKRLQERNQRLALVLRQIQPKLVAFHRARRRAGRAAPAGGDVGVVGARGVEPSNSVPVRFERRQRFSIADVTIQPVFDQPVSLLPVLAQ